MMRSVLVLFLAAICLQPCMGEARPRQVKAQEIGPEGRHYNQPLTAQDRAEIGFIVKTLSDKPIPKLVFYSGALESAGDKVEHVHPLRFLEAIFTDEELKAGVHNIRSKDYVWGQFMNGVRRSLVEESARNNVTSAQIQDFATIVGVDFQLIYPAAQACQWDQFVEVLLVHVPRRGDHNRYDM